MKKERFLTLIDKYINNLATESEKLLVEEYYNRMEAQEKNELKLNDEELLKAKTYNQIKRKIQEESKYKSGSNIRLKRQINWKWIGIAAILLVTTGLSFWIYRIQKKNAVVVTDYASLIKAGVDKAVLTLANGSKVVLDSSENKMIAINNGVGIKKVANGLLEYVHVTSAHQLDETKEEVYNKIETPRGGQYKVVLNDGTVVWLNAASSLRYPVEFNGKQRKVELTGEGYFEVAHEKSKPFIVVTNRQEVTVLGTHFNINAYTDEPAVKTTLLEGKVKVFSKINAKQGYLKSGEQAVLSGQDFNVHQVDIMAETDWKDGRFIFRDEDFASILRKLSRWYNIDVEYNTKSTDNLSFSGQISRSKSLKEVLNILTLTNDVKFKVKERRVTVMP
ncbi:DUF4974 domain-containing protein [Pedobacter sp. ISL-68]|nr:FecR family protein [Pedobacter sp. ISL-68]MBT2563740.1 DUF4974 domain-containing protein [Pedobacter sp. ISL-64]MBT2589632.1 DUF4974 domain-containing protein [Pedobacter sp. ISL-68]